MRRLHDELVEAAGRNPTTIPDPAPKDKDPFDFDAPRFTDFCRGKYRETKRLLDQIVLKSAPVQDENAVEENVFGTFDSSELSEGWWFEQPHHSHEPSSPLPPVGPLLSSQDLMGEGDLAPSEQPMSCFDLEMAAEMATPSLAAASSAQRPLQRLDHLHSSSSAYMSPNVSVLRPGGRLRAKPGRVLASRPSEQAPPPSTLSRASTPSKRSSPMLSFDSSLSSCRDMMISGHGSPLRHSPLLASLASPRPPSSPGQTHRRNLFTSRLSQLHHPTDSVQRGSPLTTVGHSDRFRSEDNWTDGRISSLPSLEGWLAAESRSSLLHMAMDDGDRTTAPPSPMNIDEAVDPVDTRPAAHLGLRKLGLGSRATRVQLPVPPSQEQAASSTSTRNPSPCVKRIRTEPAAFTQAPPSRSTKPGNVKIEDLKKILAEHNQRIRPRKR